MHSPDVIDTDSAVLTADVVLEPVAAEVVLEGEDERLFANFQSNPDEVLNYGNFLPAVKQVYDLPTLDGSVLFNYVPSSSPLYASFQAAYAKRMIGSNTNPDTKIRCGNLMVLLGLAEGWNLAYAPSTIISQFWQEAEER
ncbi:MAG: hypothetical protein H6765_09400 [Candidatus Peribacteria bacterium]|nr:MAG: hypothetical protein H6765_09400 [Candidatus Peribacteria bacterium]